MHVVVIPEDGIVAVDGVARKCTFTAEPGAHAYHWDGKHGFVERKPDSPGERMVPIKLKDLANFVQAWKDAAPQPLPPAPTQEEVLLDVLEEAGVLNANTKQKALAALKRRQTA